VKWFPIMGGPAVPWVTIEPHEAQARRNHDQSLERLAQRGGLSPMEAVLVLEDRRWPRFGEPDLKRPPDYWRGRLQQLLDTDVRRKVAEAEARARRAESALAQCREALLDAGVLAGRHGSESLVETIHGALHAAFDVVGRTGSPVAPDDESPTNSTPPTGT